MKCEGENCGRKVIYYSKKRRKLVASPDHTLCSKCYRAERNRGGHRKGPVQFPLVLPEPKEEV